MTATTATALAQRVQGRRRTDTPPRPALWEVGARGRRTTMAWSTRELAELAGTSLRAVRHYHDSDLLDEPERGLNGYKRYGVLHLVRLLEIRRLTDLGLSLAQVAGMRVDGDDPSTTLRAVDAQLTVSIARLRRSRADIAVLLEQPAPDPGLPAELVRLAPSTVSPADRTFVVLMTRVLSPRSLATLLQVVERSYTGPARAQLDALAPNAPEGSRVATTERLARSSPGLPALPSVRSLLADAPIGARRAHTVLDAARGELYNRAQVDVLQRLDSLLDARSAEPRPGVPAHRLAS